jgi:hypothetical protein
MAEDDKKAPSGTEKRVSNGFLQSVMRRSDSVAAYKRYLDVGPDDLRNLFRQENFTLEGDFSLSERPLDGGTIPESFYKVINLYDKYALFDVFNPFDLS